LSFSESLRSEQDVEQINKEKRGDDAADPIFKSHGLPPLQAINAIDRHPEQREDDKAEG
jgi:hypothetical protein